MGHCQYLAVMVMGYVGVRRPVVKEPLTALGQFTVGLQVSSLLGVVLEDNISLVVLEITEGKQDNISLIDPDLQRWSS